MSLIVENHIDKWVAENIGVDFEFREHQKEAIVGIIDNILSDNGSHTHIIEAPTGAGKSLMLIIAAGVLADVYDKTSYILCSDLFLWEQYATFIEKHPALFKKFGMVKGQTGNYECEINHQDMRNADCRLANISWATLFDDHKAISKGYKCALTCEYVKARKKAIACKVTLATYQLFLYQLNMTIDRKNSASFQERDVIFCDECHNIPDIIQCKMQPIVRKTDYKKLEDMYMYCYNKHNTLFEDVTTFSTELTIAPAKLKEEFDSIFEELTRPEAFTSSDVAVVERYSKFLAKFAMPVNDIQLDIAVRKENGLSMGKEDLLMYKNTSWYQNYMCVWNDFYTASHEAGMEYIVRQIHDDDEGGKYVTFNCTKEDWMIYHFLLRRARNRVLVSATIGGRRAFEDNLGIKYTEEPTKFEVIPSTFTFEKSPVLFLNRYKMSFKEKDKSFERLKEIVYKICREFGDKKGIIQTGTYDIARKLMFYAPADVQSRLLLYDGSKDKMDMVRRHKYSDNTILMGPTLCEGVDLPGDLCRFIVIMKVPYPHLKDKLVEMKSKLFPLWYNSKTSNSIIQGIGRGVRSIDDYCTTYILDACFFNLYMNTKEQYPEELQNRIRIFS